MVGSRNRRFLVSPAGQAGGPAGGAVEGFRDFNHLRCRAISMGAGFFGGSG